MPGNYNQQYYDPQYYDRLDSLRLDSHDYSEAGVYFVTICIAKGIRARLGKVKRGKMILNAAGEAVVSVWQEIPWKFVGVHLDAFVVMPDHFHGIIAIGEKKGKMRGQKGEGSMMRGKKGEGRMMNRAIRDSPVRGDSDGLGANPHNPGAPPVGAIHESPRNSPDAKSRIASPRNSPMQKAESHRPAIPPMQKAESHRQTRPRIHHPQKSAGRCWCQR